MPAAYVRHDEFADGFGATGFSISLGSAVASGNSLFVAVYSESYAEGGVPLTITDNQGNTYVLDRTFLRTGGQDAGFFRCHNITNGPTSIVFNWTGGGSRYVEIGFLEVSGLSASAPSDADHVRDIFATTTAVTLTTAASGECLVGLILAAPTDFTPSAGLSRYPASGGGTIWLFDDDAGTAGNKSVGGSWSAGATAPVVAASYGVAGGGGTAVPVFANRYAQFNN